jgi:hypothetical protein
MAAVAAATAGPLAGVHLFQFRHLLGRKDLLQFRFRFGFQGRDLGELILRQVEGFLRLRRQEVETTRAMLAAGAGFIAGRTVAGRRHATLILSHAGEGGDTECQRHDNCGFFHSFAFGLVSPPASARPPRLGATIQPAEATGNHALNLPEPTLRQREGKK